MRTNKSDLMAIYLVKYFDGACTYGQLDKNDDVEDLNNWYDLEDDDLGDVEQRKKIPGIMPFRFFLD